VGRQDQDRAGFYGSGGEGLARLRTAGIEPVGAVARERIRRLQRERQREENAWMPGIPSGPAIVPARDPVQDSDGSVARAGSADGAIGGLLRPDKARTRGSPRAVVGTVGGRSALMTSRGTHNQPARLPRSQTMPLSDEDVVDANAWATLHSQIHSDQHDVEDCDRAMCRAAGDILRSCDREMVGTPDERLMRRSLRPAYRLLNRLDERSVEAP
jgi:hypothetical protein